MTDYEQRYEGNGEDAVTFVAGASPPAKPNSHGDSGAAAGADELSDSKSQRSRDNERESSKSRSKDRDRGRDKDRDRDRERERDRDKEKSRDPDREKSRDPDREKSRDRDREKSRDRDRDRDRDGDRDRHRERSERRERGRDRDDDDYHRSRDYDRGRDYDRDSVFCSRPFSRATKRLTYNYLDAAFSPHSTHQRDMKKILVSEFLCPTRIRSYQRVLEMEVEKMVHSLSLSSSNTNGDIVAGAIDSTVVTSVWVMSEIVRNPRVMKKLQREIRKCTGRVQNVHELDTKEMTYLKMVVKETLRLGLNNFSHTILFCWTS